MKTIDPVQIWNNGQTKTATLLDARIIDDNLTNFCTFYWQLMEAGSDIRPTGSIIANGNCSMSGENYSDWNGSNNTAFEFIAEQINVTIVETPTTSTTTTSKQ
jgi:hypothetical protein